MEPDSNYQSCEDKFRWSFVTIMIVQLIQTVSSFTPILLVFYFIYWTHRHHARPYERKGGDILLCEDDSHSPLIRRLSSITPPREEEEDDYVDLKDTRKISRKPAKWKKSTLKRKFTMDEDEERVFSTQKLPIQWA